MNYKKRHINSDATVAITYSKWDDYLMLVKHKLSLTVVITSLLGYLIMSGSNFQITEIMLLCVGGFLVTGAANAINEVLEKDFDAQMTRTSVRPLAAGRMQVSEAVIFAGIACLFGVTLLSIFNPITGVLGMISFVIYSFIYTPLKRIGTISVAVGAIPGALPLLIGCTAYEGRISALAICLFSIQFLWQFPHFWSISFLGFDDYKKAGYKLVPFTSDGIDRKLGIYAMMYAILILTITLFMWLGLEISTIAFLICMILSLGYGFFSYMFHKQFDKKAARQLMFSSFFFMPLYLLTCLIF